MSVKFGDLPTDTLRIITTYLTIWDMQQFRKASRMFNQIYNEFYLPYEKEKLKINYYVENQIKLLIYLNQQNFIMSNKTYINSGIYNRHDIHEIVRYKCHICNCKNYTINIKNIKDNYLINCDICNKKTITSHIDCYIKFKKSNLCIKCIKYELYNICMKYHKYMFYKRKNISSGYNRHIKNMSICIVKCFRDSVNFKDIIKTRIQNNQKKSDELYTEIINFFNPL